MVSRGLVLWALTMQTIVMTGGTSGFGAVAADRIRRDGEANLLLGARSESRGTLPLDLADLDSVRGFAAGVRGRLGAGQMDALVLNAGVIRPDADHRTDAGFETTFAVNHLAHYLLMRLLLPSLSDEGRIVLTTSGTHDPAAKAGLVPPRHAHADLLAHPDRDPGLERTPRRAGQHAYTAAKLCAILVARSLRTDPGVRARRLSVVAYCPGQVFGTGLAQHLSLPWRVGWSVLGSPLGWLPRRLSGTLNSGAAAGSALADLALGRTTVPEGKEYAALRRGRLTWPEPSGLARDDVIASALWRDSSRLVGVEAAQRDLAG